MKMFNKIRLQSEWNTAMLFDGTFYDTTATPYVTKEVEDGACVSIKDPLVHQVYDGSYGHPYDGSGSITLKDLNANMITAYDAADGIVGVIDFVGVQETTVQGNMWKIGDKIAGIPVPAGQATRVRILQVGDEFYLGQENFDAVPTVGQYAAPVDTKTTWGVAAAKAASGLCLKILDKRQMIQGTVDDGIMYRVRVIQK